MRKRINKMHLINVRIGFKLFLEWGVDIFIERQLAKKLRELKLKRGRQLMMYRIYKYIVDNDLIIFKDLTVEFRYTLNDIDKISLQYYHS